MLTSSSTNELPRDASEMPLSSGVSVIVCCHNSERSIAEAIGALAIQHAPREGSWEVILVDNNCSDRTVSIATQTWEDSGDPAPLRIVKETEPGLTAARCAGVRNARYNVVLFCDDDNALDDQYLKIAAQALADHPEVGVVGGIGEYDGPLRLPEWFPHYARSFAVGPQREGEAGLFEGYLYGAGMAIRTELLLRAFEQGWNPLLSDRKGKKLSSGGDGELQEWLAILGFEGRWYTPKLKFRHLIPDDRLNLDYVEALNIGFGQAYPALRLYRRYRESQDLNFYLLWVRDGIRSVMSVVFALFGTNQFRQRRIRTRRAIASLSEHLFGFLRYRRMATEIRDRWKTS